MSDTTCGGCDRETAPGIVLCPRCVTTLDVALANIAAYYTDLDTLRTKRTRYGTTTATKGSVGKEQPLPIDGRFTDPTGSGSRLADDTKNTLVAWARTLLEEHPPTSGPACEACLHLSCHDTKRRRQPRDHVPGICAYIAGWRHHIAGQRWGADLLDEVLDVEGRLRRMVDRPVDRQFIGTCSVDLDDDQGPCGYELRATPGDATVTCEACGITHDVSDRRTFLLEQAREVAVTATEAAGALCAWTDYDGSTIKLVDLIRKWAETTPRRPARLTSIGSIEQLGRDRALYRLGDIEALVRGHVQERQINRSV